MNGFEKEFTLHVRVSKNEIKNYKKLAREMGMNISTLTRFVLNKEIKWTLPKPNFTNCTP